MKRVNIIQKRWHELNQPWFPPFVRFRNMTDAEQQIVPDFDRRGEIIGYKYTIGPRASIMVESDHVCYFRSNRAFAQIPPTDHERSEHLAAQRELVARNEAAMRELIASGAAGVTVAHPPVTFRPAPRSMTDSAARTETNIRRSNQLSARQIAEIDRRTL